MDPDSGQDWIRIQWGPWIRILISNPIGSGSRRAKMTHEQRKSQKILFFEVRDVHF